MAINWLLFALHVLFGCSAEEKQPTEDPQDTNPEVTTDIETEIQWDIDQEAVETGAFLASWGHSATDIWIVGGQFDAGIVLRGSLDNWNPQPLPSDTPLLNWVHGSSSEDIWVAGLAGTLLHWDGSEWQNHSLPIEEAFWGVHVLSENDALAVGGASKWGGENAVIYHWNGDTWSQVDLPNELSATTTLFKAGHDGTQYWVIGAQGALMYGDGQSFTAVPTGFTTDLVTINTHPDGGPTYVVGGRGTGVFFELFPDGTTGPIQQLIAGLNGVQSFPDGSAMVVGERGYGAWYDADSQSFEEIPSATLDILHNVFGQSSSQLIAVGGNLNTADTYFHGIIMGINLESNQ